ATGTISTTNAQSYNGAVVLGANTTTTSTGSGGITFGSTVNGGFSLAVNTAGTTTFSGIVGATPLTSLTTDLPGATALNGRSVTPSGGQAYHDSTVTLGTNTLLTHTGAGSLVLDGTTLSLGTFTLTDNATTAASTGTISSQITGSGGLTKNGPGTLTLSN